MKHPKTVLIFFFSLLFLNAIFSENAPEELTIHQYEFFETYGKSQAQLYEDAATLGYRDLF